MNHYLEERFGLKAKIAMVTGAGQGIGEAISIAYAKAGATVVLCGRTLSKLEAAAKQIREFNGQCDVRRMDITNEEDILSGFAYVKEKYGKLDILVNNAGITIPCNAERLELKDWSPVIDTNLTGTFLCCREAGRLMIPQKKGKIINIISTYAFVGRYLRAAYSASKGGQLQMTKTLAIEWAPYNINVNCIAPTATVTPMTERLTTNPEAMKVMLGKIPMGRLAEPEDMTGAALYLASKASDFVTGQAIIVDGGFTAI